MLVRRQLFRINGVLGGMEAEEELGCNFVHSYYYTAITDFISLAMANTPLV